MLTARPQTTDRADEAVAIFTNVNRYGGAIAIHEPVRTVVVYGVPVFVMPNGRCRVGSPDAPMIDADLVPVHVYRAREVRRNANRFA